MTFHDAAARPVLALPGFRLDLFSDDTPVAAIRAAIGDHIERMLEFLDQIDGDPDLEVTDEDQHVAWTGHADQGFVALTRAADDDLKLDTSDWEPDHDGEMSLGWQNEGSQVQLLASFDDREEDDGREEIAA